MCYAVMGVLRMVHHVTTGKQVRFCLIYLKVRAGGLESIRGSGLLGYLAAGRLVKMVYANGTPYGWDAPHIELIE